MHYSVVRTFKESEKLWMDWKWMAVGHTHGNVGEVQGAGAGREEGAGAEATVDVEEEEAGREEGAGAEAAVEV